VIYPPIFDDPARLGEVTKDVFIQHLSRSLPLNDSTKAFCIGFPGAM
tara:strand:- start:103 stop:243 length:141 start_codon:yes stop_codon:yes gene_type:complete